MQTCKHDPRTEENEILLEDGQDVGKVLLRVFCGRDESAYRNEGAQFCVVMTNSKRNKQNPRTEENKVLLRVRHSLYSIYSILIPGYRT